MNKKISLFILSSCLISTVSLFASQPYTLTPDKETRGLIRKMQVYKTPSWTAKVVTKQNREFYFVSPKSLLEFYFAPEKWPEVDAPTKLDIKELVVTDYATLKPIDATKAYYVYGSSKTSSAGDDLPAFKHFTQAEQFAKKNNGKRVIEFKDLKKGLIQLLNGDI